MHLLLLLVHLLLAAIAAMPRTFTAHAAPSKQPYPTNGWVAATPESQSMSSTRLAAAVDWVGSLQKPDALLVVRGGKLVSETYWGATTKDTLHDLEWAHVIWQLDPHVLFYGILPTGVVWLRRTVP